MITKKYEYPRESKVYKRFVEYFTLQEGRKLNKSDRKYCRKVFEASLAEFKKQKSFYPDRKTMSFMDFLEDDKLFARLMELGNDYELAEEVFGNAATTSFYETIPR
jgi:hypothetical protein